jgi:hypothetical protein
MSTLAACSGGPQGTVVDLYGGASGVGFEKILADCNPQAAGRYVAARVQRGRRARLWYDTSKLQVFDGASGRNLVAAAE